VRTRSGTDVTLARTGERRAEQARMEEASHRHFALDVLDDVAHVVGKLR
jgi:hypothetical protein